ncbi:hypothetical protein C7475_102169 [Chitinophaga sp. S165]|nr:hypothetical protein C7475_102169 [Chitinophaga sp. S165]
MQEHLPPVKASVDCLYIDGINARDVGIRTISSHRTDSEEAEKISRKMCPQYHIMVNALKYHTFAAYYRLP